MSTIVFEHERVGDQFRGVVVDMSTFEIVARTSLYAHAETARSAAESLWRAKKLQDAREIAGVNASDLNPETITAWVVPSIPDAVFLALDSIEHPDRLTIDEARTAHAAAGRIHAELGRVLAKIDGAQS